MLEKQRFGLPYCLGVRRIVAAVERGQLGYGVVGVLNRKDHLAPRLRREHENLDLPRCHDVKPLRLLACQEKHPAPAYIVINAPLAINFFYPLFGLVAGFCHGISITLTKAFVVTDQHPLASYRQAYPLILSLYYRPHRLRDDGDVFSEPVLAAIGELVGAIVGYHRGGWGDV